MLTTVFPNCAGLDVHKKFVTACRFTVDAQGVTHCERRKFSTMTADLEALASWLAAGHCTHVAMESTGVYWQPVYNILEARFELLVVNAQSIKRMAGRKTDMTDAEWIATLLQHGLLQPSFIPDRQQRELRDLSRYRLRLVQERTRFANRLQKVLEGTNIKLSAVVSDLQGVSAQAILRQLLAGETDPHILAELAKTSLRHKRAELERALVGQITPHQRYLLSDLLIHLDFLDEQIGRQDGRLEAQLSRMPDYPEVVRLLDTIPGIDRQLAILIVAEIGVDMSRFPSDRHLTAWAGVAPGNNETGGKRRPAEARQGNKYLCSGLVLGAHGAARTKGSYLQSLYHRIAARRGKGRAAVAVGRTILQMAYYMISRNQVYQELGSNYLDALDKQRTAKRLIQRLEALGFEIQATERTRAPSAMEGLPSASQAVGSRSLPKRERLRPPVAA
jgi:transposase